MKKYFGVSLNIFLLSIVSLLNDMSSEMIMPILPLFFYDLGASSLIVGLLGGLRESISSILKVFGGYFSDRTGKRKIFVSSGYFITALFKVTLAFSKIWPSALLNASLERIGKGVRTAPRDAMIAESSNNHRGRSFGLHRTFDTTGAILGSIVAFILFWYLGLSFKMIILLSAMVGFISLIPLLWVKEKRLKPEKGFKLSFKKLPKKVKKFILIACIFALANFSYMFLILRIKDFFIGRLAIGIPILFYILYNFVYATLSMPFGSLSDRIGRKKLIMFGYFLFFVVCSGFIFARSWVEFILLFALYGVVFAAVEGNQRALISDLVHEKHKATALGVFHTAVGILALPASLIAGYLWSINPNFTFMFGAGVSFIASMVFFRTKI